MSTAEVWRGINGETKSPHTHTELQILKVDLKEPRRNCFLYFRIFKFCGNENPIIRIYGMICQRNIRMSSQTLFILGQGCANCKFFSNPDDYTLFPFKVEISSLKHFPQQACCNIVVTCCNIVVSSVEQKQVLDGATSLQHFTNMSNGI